MIIPVRMDSIDKEAIETYNKLKQIATDGNVNKTVTQSWVAVLSLSRLFY